MTTDPRMTRFVQTWLEEGVNDLPDHVLNDVVAKVPSIQQRRPLRRRLLPTGRVAFRFAAATVAVVGVAATAVLIGNFRPNGSFGTVAPTASASSSYVPPMPGPLAPGTLVISDPFPVHLEMTLSDGWMLAPDGVTSDAVVIYKHSLTSPGGFRFVFATPTQFYNDRCDPTAGTFEAAPSVADFTDQLYDQQRPGVIGTPSSTELAGYSAERLQIVSIGYGDDANLGCMGALNRWVSSQELPYSATGQQDTYWVLDVDGTRVVIDAFGFPLPDPRKFPTSSRRPGRHPEDQSLNGAFRADAKRLLKVSAFRIPIRCERH